MIDDSLTEEQLKTIHYCLLCTKEIDMEMVNDLFRYIYTLKHKYEFEVKAR